MDSDYLPGLGEPGKYETEAASMNVCFWNGYWKEKGLWGRDGDRDIDVIVEKDLGVTLMEMLRK